MDRRTIVNILSNNNNNTCAYHCRIVSSQRNHQREHKCYRQFAAPMFSQTHSSLAYLEFTNSQIYTIIQSRDRDLYFSLFMVYTTRYLVQNNDTSRCSMQINDVTEQWTTHFAIQPSLIHSSCCKQCSLLLDQQHFY